MLRVIASAGAFLVLLGPLPVAAAPFLVFADGFESGHSSEWGNPSWPAVGLYDVRLSEIAQLDTTAINVVANPFWVQDPGGIAPFFAALAGPGLAGVVGFLDDRAVALDWAHIDAVASRARTHQALAAYYLPDEAWSRGVPASVLIQLYQRLKVLDPATPVLLTDYDGASQTRSAYDAFVYDFYPIGSASIEQYRDEVILTRSLARPKSMWLALQAFARLPELIAPTESELRAMAYLALIHDVEGVLAYTDVFLRSHAQLRAKVLRVLRELHTFGWMLKRRGAIVLPATSNKTGIDLHHRELGGTRFLVTLNYRSTVRYLSGHDPGMAINQARISVAGAANGPVEVVAGDDVGRVLPIVNGSFVHDFPPYSARIYRFRASP